MNRIQCEDSFKQAFMFFDCDKDGLISFKDLKNALETLGERMTDGQIEEMISEADLDKDGYLNESGNFNLIRKINKHLNRLFINGCFIHVCTSLLYGVYASKNMRFFDAFNYLQVLKSGQLK